MRAFMLASALFVVLCLSGAAAWCYEFGEVPYGASVVGTPPSGTASLSWTYRVTNTSAFDRYTLWLVAIEVDEDTEVLGAISPDGWAVDYESQPHFVTWMCYATELPRDTSQDGFGITFDGQPGYQMYSAMFTNTENPGDTPVDFGDVILGAGQTPEPTSAAALVLGLSSIVGIRLRKRH